MLKHRNIVVLFIALLIALVAMNKVYHVHWFYYVALVLVFFGIEFYGASYISSGFHLKAICQTDTADKAVALTFDDGPVSQTENVLAVLNDFDVKATFFCIGNRIKGNEAVLRKMNETGHLIGNHSYSHGFFFSLKNTRGLTRDMNLATLEIERVIGRSPAFFRPPYGVTTPGIARAVSKLNLNVIGWNIRSLDTSTKDRQKVLVRIKERLRPGSIILLHDTVDGIDFLLKDLLTYLKDNNYKVVGLDKLIQKNAYA